LHIALNGVDVLLRLFLGIGIVEAQITQAVGTGVRGRFLGQSEVQANRFGMADMQVAVRFGSGGNRVTIWVWALLSISASTRVRMKSLASIMV